MQTRIFRKGKEDGIIYKGGACQVNDPDGRVNYITEHNDEVWICVRHRTEIERFDLGEGYQPIINLFKPLSWQL